MRILHGGQAVIVGPEKLNLADFPGLKVLGCPMTGTDHLPWDEINRRGIKVVSLGSSASSRDEETRAFLRTVSSTAEHTIGLIIALLRNYKTALNGPYKNRETYRGRVLSGKTLGIIGLGRIGQQVMNIAQMLGMRVPSVDKDSNLFARDKLLSESDVVSLHVPLAGNEGFFTRAMFERMRPTSYFINTSRSGVVEQGALLWALKNKTIAGAAVDFIDDDELVWYARDHDNLILTNHQGGNTFEDMERTESFIERKVEEYINEVNKNNENKY